LAPLSPGQKVAKIATASKLGEAEVSPRVPLAFSLRERIVFITVLHSSQHKGYNGGRTDDAATTY
jgi:hypothetical protein